MKRALMVIDVQNDFCPGGALPVPEGDRVVPVINALMDRFDVVVATRDWHPPQTVHFEKWPVHCVRDTHGAAFHPDLQVEKVDRIVSKGTGNRDDGYSAFETDELDLAGWLREQGVDEVYVAGLATEYCVKASALDAARHGFSTFVITDAVRGIDVQPGDIRKAIEEMEAAGIRMVKAAEIPAR